MHQQPNQHSQTIQSEQHQHHHQQQQQQQMLLQQIPQQQQQQQWQMSQSQYEQQIQQMHHAQQLQQQQQQQYLQQQQQQQPTSSPLIRKRGLVNESDEFMGIKKRNLGSEATAQGMFGYPEIGADSPGSIMSNHSNGEAQSYFEQPHYQTSSSSSAQGPTSAPSTPAISITPSGSSQAHGWGSFGQGGSHSSPPTPQGSFGAHTASSNMFASALSEQGSVEYRMQQEKQRLQEAQQQEQQRLQEAQQMEIQAMQRQQEEHAKAQAASKTAVHHDHNDPATWGYGNSPSQFTGYLGGYGRGYTPAAIGGVAALAAASAMAASRQRTTSSGSGMDMDM